MDDNADFQLVTVMGEYLNVEALEVNPATPVGTELMAWCATFLEVVTIEPARTRLVMSGDFTRSVRDRLEPGFYRDNFTVERNNGIVGGKTMTLPNGDVDGPDCSR